MSQRKLTDLEVSLHTQDSLSQVRACLNCNFPECVNCVSNANQRMQYAAKKRRAQNG